MGKTKRYDVVWKISVDASSPVHAARVAQSAMLDSKEWGFVVHSDDGAGDIEVDLAVENYKGRRHDNGDL